MNTGKTETAPEQKQKRSTKQAKSQKLKGDREYKQNKMSTNKNGK